MKISNLLLFAFLFLFSNLKAQNLSTGIHGGINYSTITTGKKSILQDFFGYKTGYKFGANLEYRISDLVRLRTEFNMERKGAKSSVELTDENGNPLPENNPLYFHFDYYSLPLILQFYFGKKIQGFAQVGTEFSYLKKQTYIADAYTLEGEIFTVKEDLTDQFNLFDQAILIGLGMSILINERIYFQVMARTTFGIKTLNAISQPASLFSRNISHSALLGLQYHFIKKTNS